MTIIQLLIHALNDKETPVKQGFTYFEHDYYFLIPMKLLYSNN